MFALMVDKQEFGLTVLDDVGNFRRLQARVDRGYNSARCNHGVMGIL